MPAWVIAEYVCLTVLRNPSHETILLHINYIPAGSFELLMIYTNEQVVVRTVKQVQDSVYEMRGINGYLAQRPAACFTELGNKKNQTASSFRIILDRLPG